MAILGSLVVSLTANTAQFTSDLGKAAHEAEKRMKDISDAAEKMANLAAAAFVTVTGAAALLVKQAIDSADAMGKLAQSTGIAVDVLSELSFAANLSDVSTETLSQSVNRLNRNIAEAAAGTGEARRAFEALGIEVKASDGTLKNADQVLEEVADQFAQMEDGAGKSALAMMLFGRAGAQMIAWLNEGASGIRKMRQEARDLGLTISGDTAKAADAFNDNLTRLAAVKDGLANTIMRTLLPSLQAMTDEMVRASRETEFFEGIGKAVLVIFQTLTIVAANVSFVFRMVGQEIGGIAAQLGALTRFDFDQFSQIGEAMRQDAAAARAELDAFEKRIMSIGEAARQTAEETRRIMRPAPTIGGSENAAKAQADMIAMIEESRAQQEQAIAETVRLTEEANKKRIADEEHAMLVQQELIDQSTQQQLKAIHDTVEARRKSLEEYRAELMERSAALFDANRTDFEVLQEDYAQKLLLLKEYLTEVETELTTMRQNGLINEEVYQEKLTEIQARYYDAQLRMEHEFQSNLYSVVESGGTQRQAFMALSMEKQAKTIFSELANITAGVSQHNKALFELNKVAGISMAIINAYEGISLTMAKYPYPLNIAMAAAHAVAAFAQVDMIRSATFGSGGAAPSLAGSTPAPPVTPVQSGTPDTGHTTIINLQGDTFSKQALQDLVEQLNEGFGDGHRVIVT